MAVLPFKMTPNMKNNPKFSRDPSCTTNLAFFKLFWREKSHVNSNCVLEF